MMRDESIAAHLDRLFEGRERLAEPHAVKMGFLLLLTTYQGYLKDERRYYDRLWGGIDIFCLSFDLPRGAVYEALESVIAES